MTDLAKEGPLNRVLEHDRPGRAFVAIEGSRWGELIVPAADEAGQRTEAGLRIVAVTSFLYSTKVLGALLDYERAHPERLHLVAAATDDPINADAKIGLRKRIWKHYGRSERAAQEIETVETALCSGVPVYTGELKIPWFHQQLARWRPDAIIVCGCGQIFDAAILTLPRYGVTNFHPSDLAHGHGAGAEPYEDSLARNDPWTRWTVHQMVLDVDAGPIIGQSPDICVADAGGRVARDPKRFYEKLRGVVAPMVTILIEALVRLEREGGERITRIDFGAGIGADIKVALKAPIA
jgi:hypothetical protein